MAVGFVRKSGPRRVPGRLPCAAGLKIGGFSLAFESDSVGIINILEHRYAGFAGAAGHALKFRVSQAAGRAAPFKPEVLLKGDHKKIEKWQMEKAIEETQKKRPDLLACASKLDSNKNIV